MKRKLRTALAFSWQDWETLIQAWVLLLFVDVALRVLPFLKVRKVLNRQSQDARHWAGLEALPTILRTHQLVDSAARHHIYPMSCLRRALVLQSLLSGDNIVTEMRFGVQKDSNVLNAHAWLEYAGKPVGRTQNHTGNFVPLVAAEEVR